MLLMVREVLPATSNRGSCWLDRHSSDVLNGTPFRHAWLTALGLLSGTQQRDREAGTEASDGRTDAESDRARET